MSEPGIFEVMYNCRAMRRLKPDPVPPELIRKVIEAGTMAPSGSNRQPWAFVVVTEPALKANLAPLFAGACEQYIRAAEGRYEKRSEPVPEAIQRNLRATRYLADHLTEVPVLLFVFVREYKRQMDPGEGPAGSIFPAIQNMLLACRALGLGTALTSFMCRFRAELEALLGVPAEYCPVAMLPIGYPMGQFGPTRRKPVEAVTHLNGWGQSFSVADATANGVSPAETAS